MTRFVTRLRERRVIQVLLVYLAIAWGLIEVADILLPRLGLPDWTVTLVVVLLALGLPLAVGMAWVFDIGPRGIERTIDPARSPEARDVAPQEEERLRPVPAAARPAGAPSTSAPPRQAAKRDGSPSVAVLPFVNLSSDADQEYFADGLTEELLNVLAQVPGLRVPARTSSFAFKGQNSDIREIGQKLSVGTVLEGSVRSSGSRVLITAQLIDVDDGFHLWSDSYKRDLEDIFEVQEEIARRIAETLKGRLLGSEEIPQVPTATADPEAYRLYLRGRHLHRRYAVRDIREAVDLYEEAARRDPTFARAWVAIADAVLMLAYIQNESSAGPMRKAKAAIDRAIELEPGLADAYSIRARHAYFEWDFTAAERDIRRALELSPAAASAHNLLASILLSYCRVDEAIAELRLAAELDPLWSAPIGNLGIALGYLGRNEEAVAWHREALALAPDNSGQLGNLATALARVGNHVEAIEIAERLHTTEPSLKSSGLKLTCFARAGRREEAERLLEEILLEHPAADPVEMLTIHALLGRLDEAFADLESAIARRSFDLLQAGGDSGLDPLREDPRWAGVLARIGFSDEVIRRSDELYRLRMAAGADASRSTSRETRPVADPPPARTE